MSKWLIGQRVVCVLCMAFATSSQGQAHHTPPRAANAKKADPADPAEVERRNLIVATFEGGAVTIGELEDAILDQNPLMQERYQSQDAVRALLDRSVRFALMAAEAKRRGYDKSAPVVLAANQSAVQQLIQHDFDDPMTPDSVPDADIKAYYSAHIEEFVRGEGRRASIVMLADKAGADALFAKAESLDLRGFRELARTQSLDETNKQRGGDLPYFDATGKGFDSPTARSIRPSPRRLLRSKKLVKPAGPFRSGSALYSFVTAEFGRLATSRCARPTTESGSVCGVIDAKPPSTHTLNSSSRRSTMVCDGS